MPESAPKLPQVETLTIEQQITASALKYGVARRTVARIIQCESNGNPNAVGDNGHSFGLVQIYMPAHPEITKAQALDPNWSIDYLAKKLSQGKGRMWSCF